MHGAPLAARVLPSALQHTRGAERGEEERERGEERTHWAESGVELRGEERREGGGNVEVGGGGGVREGDGELEVGERERVAKESSWKEVEERSGGEGTCGAGSETQGTGALSSPLTHHHALAHDCPLLKWVPSS